MQIADAGDLLSRDQTACIFVELLKTLTFSTNTSPRFVSGFSPRVLGNVYNFDHRLLLVAFSSFLSISFSPRLCLFSVPRKFITTFARSVTPKSRSSETTSARDLCNRHPRACLFPTRIDGNSFTDRARYLPLSRSYSRRMTCHAGHVTLNFATRKK